MASDETVTATVLGSWLGLSRTRVGQLAQNGTITREAKGRYPLRQCVAEYCTYLQNLSRNRTETRADIHEATLEKMRLENAQRRGELLPLEQVVEENLAILAEFRRAVRSLANRLPALCEAHGQQETRRRVLDAEIRATLNDAASRLTAAGAAAEASRPNARRRAPAKRRGVGGRRESSAAG